MAKILVVEDNQELASILSSWLQSKGYVVDVVHSGEDAMQLLGLYVFDLLILDWELPGMHGISVCERYRKSGGSAPILFLTGRSDLESKVSGLESGADDYLSKPFEFSELSARVRSLLRRPAGLVNNVLTAPGISLQIGGHAAIVGDKEVSLTPREYGLLEFLLRHQNRAYSSKALLGAVWPLDSALSEDTVRSCMRSLRKKISLDGEESAIKTVQGFGYTIENKSSLP